jgi:hypothetical protein
MPSSLHQAWEGTDLGHVTVTELLHSLTWCLLALTFSVSTSVLLSFVFFMVDSVARGTWWSGLSPGVLCWGYSGCLQSCSNLGCGKVGDMHIFFLWLWIPLVLPSWPLSFGFCFGFGFGFGFGGRGASFFAFSSLLVKRCFSILLVWWYWVFYSGPSAASWAILPNLFLLLGYFSDRVSFFWPRAGLGVISSNLYLLYTYYYRSDPPCLAYLLKWSLSKFLPGLASNHDPPNLHFQRRWDHRHEPLCLVSLVF